MSAICLVFFLCILAVDSQLIYPANNDGQQTLQDMLHILESQKKNSDLILLGQANITNILRTSCSLQYQGEFVVSDEDVELSYKSSLDSCKSDCLKSTQCRIIYYVSGFCSIVNKDAGHSLIYPGSMLYLKMCAGIHGDVIEVLRQLTELIQKVNDISSDVKSLREGLTKANIIP